MAALIRLDAIRLKLLLTRIGLALLRLEKML
jgi:hypothetical protein